MKLTAFVAALLLGTTAMAQTPPAAPAAPAYTFALKGFVSASGAYQSGTFSPSEGQLSNYSATPLNQKDKDSVTFDVRHSRFNFSVKGPPTSFGATPTGILEIDFMGGNGGTGANANTSVYSRLRIAVAELNWGAHKIQFGQQNDLIFAMAPTSLSHIGQPLGYGTGNSGFRRPGIFGFHTFAVNPDLKVEGAWEIGRSSWSDGTTSITNGEASGGPALEGRVTVNYGKLLTAWAAAHWNQADLSGIGVGANPAQIVVTSYNAGAKLTLDVQPVTVTVQGTGFVGQNAGTLSGNLGSGFGVGPVTATKDDRDVASMGWWGQAGVNLTKEFSLWALYGQQKVDERDFAKVAANDETKAFENATTNVIAMYRDAGFGLSLEWINFQTKYAKDAASIVRTAGSEKVTATRTAKSDQYMLTGAYFF